MEEIIYTISSFIISYITVNLIYKQEPIQEDDEDDEVDNIIQEIEPPLTFTLSNIKEQDEDISSSSSIDISVSSYTDEFMKV